jgi:hypothetical protein
MKRYQRLASALQAHDNCQVSGNTVWEAKHQETIDALMGSAPSGSGFDRGTELVRRDGHFYGGSIAFTTHFHHQSEGCYSGWTEHTVTIKPHLVFGIHVLVSGPNHHDIKSYIRDVFSEWLDAEVPHPTATPQET